MRYQLLNHIRINLKTLASWRKYLKIKPGFTKPKCCYFFIIVFLAISFNHPVIAQTNNTAKGNKTKKSIAKPNKLYLLLFEVLSKNKKIEAAELDLEGSGFSTQASFAGLLPTIKLTANTGHERQQKHSAANTATGFRETGIKVTQLVYDFGKVSAGYEISKMNQEKTKFKLSEVETQVLFEGVSAYIGLLSTFQAYQYAQASELRIKKVYGTEEFRVKRGSGLASNLLQVRRRLASARRTTLLRQTSFLAALTNIISIGE